MQPISESNADGSATAAALPNPLHRLHEQTEAEFQHYADLEIVSTFGQPQAEYAAIRRRCALMDLPQRGILELTGKDRLPFLNNLLTNETWNKATKMDLRAGQGVYAFLLNVKGRILTDLNVVERGDRTLLEMDARLVATTKAVLEKYLFAEQVTMTSRVAELHELALHGPGALAVLEAATAAHVGELPPMASASVTMFGAKAIAWRDDPCGVPGYHLIVPTHEVGRVWQELLSRFYESADPATRPLRPAGWAAFNSTRIEAGRPLFAIDFDDSVLPVETGQLERGVSFTKGCYLGQEIVARMHARGQIARQLAGLRMESDHLPIAGEQVFDEQSNPIGVITSSTISPVLSNAAIALALLKKPFFAEGTIVQVPAEGAVRTAAIVKLPFV
jgi:folate-binding protein YgfZ